MSYDVAHETCLCRFLQTGEHRRHGGLLRRHAFLDRISYPVALLVAAVLGFEGALVALSASEAVTTKQGPPAALRVDMAKPPQCSIETSDQMFFSEFASGFPADRAKRSESAVPFSYRYD